jgi:hypothetical protein
VSVGTKARRVKLRLVATPAHVSVTGAHWVLGCNLLLRLGEALFPWNRVSNGSTVFPQMIHELTRRRGEMILTGED